MASNSNTFFLLSDIQPVLPQFTRFSSTAGVWLPTSSTQTNVLATPEEASFLVLPNGQISDHATSLAISSNSSILCESPSGMNFSNPPLRSNSILGQDYARHIRENYLAVEWDDASVASSPVIKKRYLFSHCIALTLEHE